jgi:hypothetical protein
MPTYFYFGVRAKGIIRSMALWQSTHRARGNLKHKKRRQLQSGIDAGLNESKTMAATSDEIDHLPTLIVA